MTTGLLPEREETLIRGEWVLPMSDGPEIRNGAVHIRGEEIVAVGEFEALLAAEPQASVVGDGSGIVVPGFVNTHTHLSEALLPGMGSELPLFVWGQQIVTPAGEHLTREMALEGTLLKTAEMLHSGITTVSDMFVHANDGSYASLGVVDGLDRSGMRGVVSFGAEDALGGVSGVQSLTPEAVIDEHLALEARAAKCDLVGFRYGIGTLLGQSDALLKRGVEMCHEKGWAVHTHMAEVREELSESALRWGRRTVDHAESLGLLDLQLLAAHVIWITESDVAKLAEHGVTVAHNPVANMILGSGVCPVVRLRSAGVSVGVGTDGASSNDSQNMLEAIKVTALLQKVNSIDPAVISANDALAMATIDGARALGLDSMVGSLVPGKRADVVLLEGTSELASIHDPYQQVVYCSSPRAVRDVWVDGRRLLDTGELASISEKEQVARCRPLAAELAAKAGLVERGWSWLTTMS
jgi:cytosine/adenosine deaminase-related metal-dependent hydrolase